MSGQLNAFDKTLLMSTSSSESPHILIVDDDDSVLNILSDALTEKNFLVDTAETAEAAMEKMAEIRYNLLLIDVNLPGMSGKELLQYTKEVNPSIAVIMMTGSPELDAAVSMMKEGAFDYLSKPIEIKKLNERIQNVLKKRAAIQIDPVLAPIMKSIPAEFNIAKIISTTDTSIVLLVEKESKYLVMKIMKYDMLDDYAVKKIKRFFREAQVMRSISHPNIVKVYEYCFDEEKLPYIIAEYVPSTSLTKELMDGMDFNQKLVFIYKLAGALWAVHKKGISHRDIKPSNIMVTSQGEPKLTDFGIAGIKDSSLTMTKEILGSPRYMPPEAFISFRKTDSRSDIFALGLVLYEMLTGRHAFGGNNINQIIHAVTTQKPVRPSVLNPEVSPRLENILARMLAKDPNQRYQNTAMLAMDLDNLIKDKPEMEEESKGFFSSMFKKSKSKELSAAWRDEI